MKKSIVALFAVALMATSVQAQESYNSGKFNPLSVDVSLNLFGNNFNNFDINRLNVRYFLDNQSALRFDLGFSMSTDKATQNTDNNDPNADKKKTYAISNDKIETIDKETYFKIGAAYEMHNNLSDKIDLYGGAGVGVFIDLYSAKQTQNTEGESQTVTFNNATGDVTSYSFTTNSLNSTANYYKRSSNGANQNGMGIYVDAFGGIDFYLYKNLYLGAELGVYYQYYKAENGYAEFSSKQVQTTLAGPNNLNTTKTVTTTTIDASTKTGATKTDVVVVTTTATGTTENKTTNNGYTAVTNNKNVANNIGLYMEPSLHIGVRF